jgi:hypothetical protein
VAEPADLPRELQVLEIELRKLEIEYNQFFAGRLPRPPWESRKRVEQLVKRLDRAHIANYGDRFRFTTLQSRYAMFTELWERGLRTREEGRGGFGAAPKRDESAPVADPKNRVLHVAAFANPGSEGDKLRELYDRLSEARKSVGEAPVPFSRFSELVQDQVGKLRQRGSAEVAFRVAVKDGKVSFTAKGVKGGT